ncbi:class I mannose-6-phosphate isomerase [Qipengyuania marisflavi]|uniref:Mannose-6-phosphate isomerase n=1 Tax=Qipengyuania marisflavi TaxID=2486356 RepID=A0A5S3P091_9SPHN|nr:class I mannose-6-phosphate isomerase [Qipengyuania marisflavi]TMM46129.1 mannose-6-phosphate isomerase [Qipengyuania marisflavi]
MTQAVLPTKTVAKIWGRETLPAPFTAPAGERIGEIWFDPPPALDRLLAKYLFTSDKLSVQVHPRDEDLGGAGSGKEECWLVIAAEPGARLALGFSAPVDPEQMRTAALDGSIEDLLDWRDVSAGEFFYIPAGTVHAIGAGLSLVEIQQNSEITYRLYDYGRPRALHLDEAIAVASGGVFDAGRYASTIAADETRLLVDGPKFRLAQIAGYAEGAAAILGKFTGAAQLLPLSGSVRVADLTVEPGQSAWASGFQDVTFASEGRCLIAAPL